MASGLQLLGAPKLLVDGRPADLPLDRPASLGYYLAQRGDWVRRAELAYLYSPEADEGAAFANLRKLVYRLRQQGWAEALEAEPARLRLRLPTDAQAFRAALERRDWAEALRHYGGPFLQGLAFPDLGGYEAWLELERQDLARLWRTALLEHARALEARADWPGAERWLARLLGAEPLDEEAVQALMRVLRGAGRPAQAAEAFERFRQGLRAEMGAEPLESTRALADGLRTAPAAPAETARPKHNLPAPATRFVGRARELEALARQLANPDCRLLTLVGLGGMGKTRLALELALQQTERFADGVWLVPLAGMSGPDLLASGIAAALGLGLSGPGEPKAQLLGYLRGKEMLLLLDNFEHLTEGGLLLEELLAQAPGLKLLVTSRVALELSSEWLHDLEGLTYPPPGAADPQAYDAVRLFVGRAERLSADFVLTAPALAAAGELARRVQGMPLALELAATWVRGLGVGELVAQLGRSFDLLHTTRRDIPERHRNLQAVLDYTWGLLGEAEQGVLARLSVFRGGFTLEAAQSVAGAHLGLLLRLINHALVRRADDGRYDMHELVRQFAAEKLGPLDERGALEGHLHYCAGLAEQARKHLTGPEQVRWRARLSAEHDNFTHALEWGLDQYPGGAVTLAAHLGNYWHTRSLYAEGIGWLRRALAHGPAAPPYARARVHLEYLRLLLIKGDFEAARALEPALLGLCRELGDAGLEAEVYNQTGWGALVRRQFGEAQALLEKGLSLSRQAGDEAVGNHLLLNLARLARFQKDGGRTKAYLESALELANRRGDPQMQMMTLSFIGTDHLMNGDYRESIAFGEEALAAARRVDHKPSVAVILGNLGYARWQLGQHAEGERVYREHIVLLYEQGSWINFCENAFELSSFWSQLGFAEDAVRLWGIAEQVRLAQSYPLFDGYEAIESGVLGAVEEPRRAELLLSGKGKSPQEVMQFLKSAASAKERP